MDCSDFEEVDAAEWVRGGLAGVCQAEKKEKDIGLVANKFLVDSYLSNFNLGHHGTYGN